MDTKTVTPSPTLSWSTNATRFSITPSDSSFWIRFPHGVEDKPTRCPISATDSEASCCNSRSILRSTTSIRNSPFKRLGITLFRPTIDNFSFAVCGTAESRILFRQQCVHLGAPRCRGAAAEPRTFEPRGGGGEPYRVFNRASLDQ